MVVNNPNHPYIAVMTDQNQFDAALITSAFAIAGARGWRHVSAASAAHEAGLDLATARQRFAGHGPILKKFGQLADQHALTNALTEGTVKDRLFDILLRRIDFLQSHRAGVIALLRTLPLQAPLAAWLARETEISMGWILEAAGVSALGPRGAIRKNGLLAVWLWGFRAWTNDESEDLSATMAAFDVALTRADQIAARFTEQPPADVFVPETEAPPAFEPSAPEPPPPEPPPPEIDPTI
jgi:hypothetical protein